MILLLLAAALAPVARAQDEPEFFALMKCLKTGEARQPEAVNCDLEVHRASGRIRILSSEKELLTLEKTQIRHLVYERITRRRVVSNVMVVWPIFFTKGRKNFLTVQYVRVDGKSDFLSLSLDKSNYEQILVALEEATGVKAERHLDEAPE
ncbi:MAG: hypothetical protein SF339_13990 [Blastocatellia bacterium]|nr:hypothetical protein [Blastocatellia bacterium]